MLLKHVDIIKNVFFFPPWEEIYQKDKERRQDFVEAKKTYEYLKSSYIKNYYNVIEMPLLCVNDRVDFIFNYLFK